MANIDPAPSWADIRQLETTDRNLAGPGGVLNTQPTSIAARLNLLRNNATALNNTVAGVSSRQDAADSAIASLESQVLDAPGTLSDLDHGAPISVTGDQFPDVLSIDNSRGPVLALNESIAGLAQRDEWLKAQIEPVRQPNAAALIGYTEITARTVDDRLKESASLMDFVDAAGFQINHTQMLIAALAASGTVHIPAGQYTLQSGQVLLASNKTIIADENAVITFNAASGQADTNFALMAVGTAEAPVVNVAVIGGRWVSNNDRTVVLGVRSYTRNISIHGANCINTRALHANDSAAGSYAASTFATRPKNITVSNCVGMCTTQVTNNSFAQFNYVDGGGCWFNSIDGYWFGESWWGGDSNHNVNGAEGSERKCTALRFVGSVMGRNIPILYAGVWGSMGEGILVDSVVAIGNETTSDVGIDFEGCVASSATNCYVKNFRNGGLATFYLNNGITFNSCEVVITATTIKTAARINNASGLATNKNISITNCSFIDTVGTARVIDAGAHTNTLYQCNRHLNVGTRFHSNNNGMFQIASNVYQFTIAPDEANFSALHVGRVTQAGGTALLRDNFFYSSVTWSVGVAALSLESVDILNMNVDVIGGGSLGNQFPSDLTITHSGTNASNTLQYNVDGYLLFGGKFTINNTGVKAPVGYLVNCKSGAGRAPWPAAIPTTGYWNQGQVVDLRRSAAIGGYAWAVCLGTGTPGTWGRYGSIV